MKFILDGKKIVPCDDIITWAKWFEKADRHVAKDKIGESKISTVFLGVDHQFGDGDLLLFKTMVFDGPLDGEQNRCSTWEEAEKMHLEMCERVRTA